MANHFIHYIKRDVILNAPDDPDSPFYAELQAYDSGFDVPAFHVTRSTSWPVKEIHEDDVIWLVGQLSAGWGTLPPAIDGKVVVGKIEELELEEGKSKTRFTAKEGSRWFPLADASDVLSNLEVILKNGEIKQLYDPKSDNLGQAFQSLKKIVNPSTIEMWASELLKKEFEFISYRIADGTKGAFFKAQQQIKQGSCVFWDRWSLPRRLAERRELVSDEALDNLLMKKIKESSLVWGIESPRYDEEGSYSRREKQLALEMKKYNGSSIA
ncbi:hypothetical protein SAMN02745866_00328 [Alteromonadaceae bacterium Bs31]|nr:hypothetical protein SAMN02745866_00328 [Alteromonadaceae bacterium Bs31]